MKRLPAQYRKPPMSASNRCGQLVSHMGMDHAQYCTREVGHAGFCAPWSICWNCNSFNVRTVTAIPEVRMRCNDCGANGQQEDFRGVESSAAIVNAKRRA